MEADPATQEGPPPTVIAPFPHVRKRLFSLLVSFRNGSWCTHGVYHQAKGRTNYSMRGSIRHRGVKGRTTPHFPWGFPVRKGTGGQHNTILVLVVVLVKLG